MMAALLDDFGYAVITGGSVAEGWEMAQAMAFDLYLLDVRLPDGTGVELCQRLRGLHPTVPVLYYSAYGTQADHEAALATCGDAYLRKPVRIAEIENTIAGLLAKSRSANPDPNG